MKKAAYNLIAGLIAWAIVTAILVAPVWALVSFAELRWVNPVGNEIGRFCVGMIALVVGAFTIGTFLDDK